MRSALAVLLTVHALLHVTGFLESFGFAEFPQLTLPIPKPLGIAWLVAALALLGAVAALFVQPGSFWLVGAFGIPQRWSTPLTGYRAFGAFRLASHGDARYAPTSGWATMLNLRRGRHRGEGLLSLRPRRTAQRRRARSAGCRCTAPRL
jgi:hypothetical protein